MIIGLLHANKKIRGESPCRQCRKPILVGEPHAVVFIQYGKAQEAAQQTRRVQESYKRDEFDEPTGRKIGKREGLKYRRLHLRCLTWWLAGYYHSKSKWRKEHRKGGRPPGSRLSDEERKRRAKLVRTRAWLLREMSRTVDEEKIHRLNTRVVEMQAQIEEVGGEVATSMARRSQKAKEDLTQKILKDRGRAQ